MVSYGKLSFRYLAVLNNAVVDSPFEKQKAALEAYTRFYNSLDKKIKDRIGLLKPVPYIIDKQYVAIMYNTFVPSKDVPYKNEKKEVSEEKKITIKKRNSGFRNWFRSKKEIV